MNKKITIAVVILAIILIAGVGFWRWKKSKNAEIAKQNIQQQIQNQQQNLEQPEFVVDVDSNVDHWQTKGENEAFTIKFPKEWYWLESSHGEREGYSRVITNNLNFDIAKHADIGIFSGIGPNSPLILSNATEVVMTNRGTATSDAGTPQDSLDAIFEMAKDNNPSVDCKVTNNKTIPFTAYCTATYDSQLQQSYYIINNKISLTLTARTTNDTLVKKEILDKIAGSIILK